MDVADKSVATDDLPEAACLEAVLNALVEQKVAEMQRSTSGRRFVRAVSDAGSKTLARRLRIATLSTSVAARDEGTNRKRRRRRRRHWNRGRDRGATSRSRSRSPPPTLADIDDVHHRCGTCCCVAHSQPDTCIPVNGDEDYVSLQIDDLDDDEEDEYEARRRRRKRRKRRRKRRMLRAMAAVAVVEEVRAVDPDELPAKARWTIVATAGLLLFMCLMLVGVTLRMAPLIDDMVRKENEALMHSLHGNGSFDMEAAMP